MVVEGADRDATAWRSLALNFYISFTTVRMLRGDYFFALLGWSVTSLGMDR